MSARILLILGIALSTSGAAQTAVISGTVVDVNGHSLSDIVVAYNSLPLEAGKLSAGPAAFMPSVASSVKTDSHGAFTIQGLPPGRYHLCALAAASGQISSCQFGARPFVASVSASAMTSGVQLLMGSGDVVKVHVQNSTGSISRGARFRLSAIATNATDKFAKPVGQSSQGLEYELTIAKGMTSRLVVDTDLVVTDSTGSAVAAHQSGAALAGPAEITLVVK